MRSTMALIDALTAWAVTGGTRATLAAIGHGRVGQLVTGHDLVHQAEALGLGGVEGLGAEQELLGLARPELPRLDQQLDAGARHAQHRVGEPGVVGGHDQVAHAGQHQTGGRAGALHGGDGRLGEVVDAHAAVEVHDLLVVELALGGGPHRGPRLGGLEQLLEVVAGAEVLALGGQHHDPHVVVGLGQVEGAVDLVDELRR